MGGVRSTIAMHPERSRIEAALRAGTPATHVAEQFSLSRQAVSRHKTKLAAKPAGAADDDRESMRRQIQSLYNATVGLVEEAGAAKKEGRFLKAVAEARKCLALLSKILGVLNEPAPPPVAVVVNVDLTELKSVILVALSPYPAARQAVAAALIEHDQHDPEGEA